MGPQPTIGPSHTRYVLLLAFCLGVAQCEPSSVQPGFYEPLDAGHVQPVLAEPASTSTVNDATPTRPCDLTGRWLITEKTVVDGQGQLATVH
jgi:hypothetical protein